MGKKRATVKGNALFGIKATKSWQGETMACNTFEVYDGNKCNIVDCFRVYDS